MAGRAPERPRPVEVLSVANVSDPATQRALEQMQDAIQRLQDLVRSLTVRVEVLEP